MANKTFSQAKNEADASDSVTGYVIEGTERIGIDTDSGPGAGVDNLGISINELSNFFTDPSRVNRDTISILDSFEFLLLILRSFLAFVNPRCMPLGATSLSLNFAYHLLKH